MRLTARTDYALRTLVVLAVRDRERVSLREISSAFSISEDHIKKVSAELTRLGFVDSVRGRNGGIRLARAPSMLTVGEVVRAVEPFELVECFREAGQCSIYPGCQLRGALREAQEAFLVTLDGVTLADMVTNREQLVELLH